MKFSLVCNLALGMSERLKRFRLLIKSKENNLVANKYKKIKKKKNKVLLTNQLHPLSSVNYQRNNNKDFKRSV